MRSWQQLEIKKKRSRTVKKERTRFVLLMMVAILFVAVSLAQIQAVSGEDGKYTEVTVERGDSLWSLSSRHKPEHLDTRDYIEMVVSLNDLNSAVLFPGQVLKMP